MEPVTEIPVDMDQEEVAYIFDKYHLISAPVVEPGGRLVGQITVDDIVGVIQEESERGHPGPGRRVRRRPRRRAWWSIVRSRLPWLLVNTVTAALAASVIGAFQGEIAKLVTLAMLMPIVASLGGNAGTQTLAVAVRALAIKELNAANADAHLRPRDGVGLLNGVVLGLVLGGRDLRHLPATPLLSLTIGAGHGHQPVRRGPGRHPGAAGAGAAGRDPAVSSSVFVTFVTDFIGFFAFLGLAALILL